MKVIFGTRLRSSGPSPESESDSESALTLLTESWSDPMLGLNFFLAIGTAGTRSAIYAYMSKNLNTCIK